MTTAVKLRIAFVLFPLAQPLDIFGPYDVIATMRAGTPLKIDTPVSSEIVFVAESLAPIELAGGCTINPQMTFDQAESEPWDAILVPGGPGTRPWLNSHLSALAFISTMGPKVEYVLSVCTGSWLLARTGLLKGHKATSNKAFFKKVKESTSDLGIDWVPEARWLVSGKFWFSSGVAAGIDMAAGFVRHVLSLHLPASEAQKVGDQVMGLLEISEMAPENDPFAKVHGLVG